MLSIAVDTKNSSEQYQQNLLLNLNDSGEDVLNKY